MNILFITKHKWPHIGGVERHIYAVNKILKNKDYKITTLSEEDIKYPKIKIIGLLYIWFWFLKNINIFLESDIVHIHDVFIWYLPFRFIFPFKKVYITFHGWEGKWPLSAWAILNKRIANKLCSGSISVGNYINKWYGIKSNFIIHGGVEKTQKINDEVGYFNLKNKNNLKVKNSIVWLGRLEKDTGIEKFQQELQKSKNPELKVIYVTNVKNPEKYLKTAEYCAPSGYLSYLEAKSYGCKIMTFANNPLKEDYWKEIKKLKKILTWDEVASIYLKLWRS